MASDWDGPASTRQGKFSWGYPSFPRFAWTDLLRGSWERVQNFFFLLPDFARIISILLKWQPIKSCHWNRSLRPLTGMSCPRQIVSVVVWPQARSKQKRAWNKALFESIGMDHNDRQSSVDTRYRWPTGTWSFRIQRFEGKATSLFWQNWCSSESFRGHNTVGRDFLRCPCNHLRQKICFRPGVLSPLCWALKLPATTKMSVRRTLRSNSDNFWPKGSCDHWVVCVDCCC